VALVVETSSEIDRRPGSARQKTGVGERDFVSLGIALAAVILFVGTAGVVLPALFKAWNGEAASPDVALTNALLLNVALILLGWQRYKSLSAELKVRRKSEEEARRLADIDHLTGCFNRRSFTTLLGDRLTHLERREHALAAIALDLDNFKQVNDLYGHQAGDEVLRNTADRIDRLLPDGAILARLGGDEFVCVVPYHPEVPDRVDQLTARMAEQVARPVKCGTATIDITISIGIASSRQLDDMRNGTTSAQSLMHKADIAMYHAKKQGKNRFYWFEPSMENELRFRNELEAGIRRGIVNGEFRPYYEQQIDLETGRIVGFEMLARWESPEMGLVGPDIFIPIAEDIAVIGEMSEKLIAQAFQDALAWDASLTLSVNISPVQMRDPWFAQKLLKLLVQHNFPANRLVIEITESCLLENVGMVRSMITSLRNQGVHISLDDFGTGYSSLAQLRSLPFDNLKIDRAFIAELKNEEDGAKLVDAILAMSDGLKLPVTAEGIENEIILETLKRMGKMKGQGYHYGRPEPAADVLRRLEEQDLLAKDLPANVTEIDFGKRQPGREGGTRAV